VKTPIGQDLREDVWLQTLFGLLAVIAVSIDMWPAAQAYLYLPQGTTAALVLLVFVLPGKVSRESLGLRLKPIQPLGYWVRVTIVIAGIMLVFILACAAAAWILKWEIPVRKTPPHWIGMALLHMCLIPPLFEELVFRLGICVPATALVGPTGAIVLSGAAFAAMHFIYGGAGPDNFVAGYILAWAFLKSGSILVPMALHALGNSVALAVHVLAWYFL